MGDLEVLKRYVKIADMTDLRFMATQYALEQNWECLDIVTDRIKEKLILDRKKTTLDLESCGKGQKGDAVSNPDTKIMASVKRKYEDRV